MLTKEVKASIIDDYYNSGLTVKQIAAKNGCGVRTVYKYAQSKHHRTNALEPRRSLHVTLPEAKVLLCLVRRINDLQYPGFDKSSVENRLVMICRDLKC